MIFVDRDNKNCWNTLRPEKRVEHCVSNTDALLTTSNVCANPCWFGCERQTYATAAAKMLYASKKDTVLDLVYCVSIKRLQDVIVSAFISGESPSVDGGLTIRIMARHASWSK
jgi:hypothetical protein